MEIKKKNAKGLIIAIVILVILVIALGGYISYDKFLSKDNTETTEENAKNKANAKNEIQNTEEDGNSSYVKTRICTGIYSGSATVSLNAQTGEYEKGILTIELKADGSYELKKDNNINSLGSYTIINNALLLTTTPSTCGPGVDCSPKYSEFLSISEDCSKIFGGYGSYFFEPDFTLDKQN